MARFKFGLAWFDLIRRYLIWLITWFEKNEGESTGGRKKWKNLAGKKPAG